MTKNNFTIVFDTGDQNLECRYTLEDSPVAEKWFKKIKHLKNIPIDPIESELEDVSDLQGIYTQFCQEYNITEVELDLDLQQNLNLLHEMYEKNHETISRLKNNKLLYKFHHAIHQAEQTNTTQDQIFVSWGTNEGPLTESFNCHDHYAEKVTKNNIYLPWAELGKKPLTYWLNNEPDSHSRMFQLCKPHTTLRALFYISHIDRDCPEFPGDFVTWFDRYKKDWLRMYNLQDYIPKHHYNAPLLARADHNHNLQDAKFVKIHL